MNKNFVVIMLGTFILGMAVIFGTVVIGKVSPETNRESRFEDKMMITAFSANLVGEIGTIASVLASTNGVSQVRVSYGSKGHENYALATMPVTNGQTVKVIGVTARHSEAPGVLPSFTRLVLPY